MGRTLRIVLVGVVEAVRLPLLQVRSPRLGRYANFCEQLMHLLLYLFVLLKEVLDLFDFVVEQLGWLLLVLFILNFLQKLTLTRYVAPRLANVAVNEQVLVPIRRVVILRFY